MNRAELGERIADFIFRKKVEGTISAVLPSAIVNSSRYVVTTQKEILDVHVPNIETHGFISYSSYTYHPPLERGSQINVKVWHVKPWIDGQIV